MKSSSEVTLALGVTILATLPSAASAERFEAHFPPTIGRAQHSNAGDLRYYPGSLVNKPAKALSLGRVTGQWQRGSGKYLRNWP